MAALDEAVRLGPADLGGAVFDLLELQEELVRGACPTGRSTRGRYRSGSSGPSGVLFRIPAMPTTDSAKPIADSRRCRSPWGSGGP